nr:class I mannose-6-phosphate isomerase [uncultured Sphingosinicella sp.]
MTATRLVAHRVKKVWGRRDLPPAFGSVPDDAEPIGEIHFEDPRGGGPELLVKYLFTAERLSIQVHPDDEAAHALGHPRGKDEAWFVLSAEPDAEIGIGLRQVVAKEELRAAALDGRIENMVDWRSVAAGDSYYSPAGTVHAIGPGLALIEVQQNLDLTYRLYDYGRPRELHLDAAIEVADAAPYQAPLEPYRIDTREILADGPAFVLERWRGPCSGRVEAEPSRAVWIIPMSGSGTIDGQPLEAGSVWLVEGSADLSVGAGTDMLVSYPGRGVRNFDAIRFDATPAPIQRRLYRDAAPRRAN